MANETILEVSTLSRDNERLKSLVRRFGFDNEQLQDVLSTLSDPSVLNRLMSHADTIEGRAFAYLAPEARASINDVKDSDLRTVLLASMLAKREGKRISDYAFALDSEEKAVSFPKQTGQWLKKETGSEVNPARAAKAIEEILQSEPYLRLPSAKQAEYYALLMSAGSPEAQLRAAAKVKRVIG